MPIQIKSAQYLYDYNIAIVFNTNEVYQVDFKDFIFNTDWAIALQNINQFKQFYLDEWPTLAWQCGIDIAPETIYKLATGKSPQWN